MNPCVKFFGCHLVNFKVFLKTVRMWLTKKERQFLAGALLDRDNEQQDGKGLGKESSSLRRRPGFTMFQVERFNTHNTTSVNTYTHTD